MSSVVKQKWPLLQQKLTTLKAPDYRLSCSCSGKETAHYTGVRTTLKSIIKTPNTNLRTHRGSTDCGTASPHHSAVRSSPAKQRTFSCSSFNSDRPPKEVLPFQGISRVLCGWMCQASLSPFSNQQCRGESKAWSSIATAVLRSAHCTGQPHWMVCTVAQDEEEDSIHREAMT